MAEFVMKLLCTAQGPSPFDGQYLVEYDPSIPGYDPGGEVMLCHLATTPDRDKAKKFSSFVDVMIEWKRQHGLREDGKPNRPLTSFTMKPEAL
jgi:hypothetical protein